MVKVKNYYNSTFDGSAINMEVEGLKGKYKTNLEAKLDKNVQEVCRQYLLENIHPTTIMDYWFGDLDFEKLNLDFNYIMELAYSEKESDHKLFKELLINPINNHLDLIFDNQNIKEELTPWHLILV